MSRSPSSRDKSNKKLYSDRNEMRKLRELSLNYFVQQSMFYEEEEYIDEHVFKKKSLKNFDDEVYVQNKRSRNQHKNDDDNQTSLKYFPDILYRRAALGYLEGVSDPDLSIKEMCISINKSAREYTIDQESNIATLEGGYRVCRCTNGFNYSFLTVKTKNKFFWEYEFIKDDLECSHIRVGIATTKANIDMPIASDENGYCIRDLGGAYFNRQKVKETPRFYKGDVIGTGIEILPECSKLHFWINGNYIGLIFDNIPSNKVWFPALSCYKGAIVKMYFNRFKHPQDDWIPSIRSPKIKRDYKWTIKQFEGFLKKYDYTVPKEATYVISRALIPYPDLPR